MRPDLLNYWTILGKGALLTWGLILTIWLLLFFFLIWFLLITEDYITLDKLWAIKRSQRVVRLLFYFLREMSNYLLDKFNSYHYKVKLRIN